MAVRVACVGDVMLARLVERKAREGDVVHGAVREYLAQCDVCLCNLECTASEAADDEERGPFIHVASALDANVLSLFQFCALANNHTLDAGIEGARCTVRALARHGIAFSGVGKNYASASRPALLRIGGAHPMIVLSIADHFQEWAASDSTEGTHIFNVSLAKKKCANQNRRRIESIRCLRDIVRTAKRANACGAEALVVFSVHWQENYAGDVKKSFRRFARLVIDHAECDMIHGHGPHHLQGVEFIGRGVVIYSAGDFISDYDVYFGPEQATAVDMDAHCEQHRVQAAAHQSHLSFIANVHWNRREHEWTAERVELLPLLVRGLSCSRIPPSDAEHAEWVEKVTDACNALGTRVQCTGATITVQPAVPTPE